MRISSSRRFPGARSTLRFLLLTLAGAFAAFLTYRVLFVYRVRVGTCGTTVRPSTQNQPAFPTRSIVVLAWNVEGHAALIDDDHMDEIAEVIRRLEPDLAILQEVHRGTWQARFRDQAAELARSTGMTVAFGPSLTIGRGEFGNAVLARGNVESVHVHPLPTIGEPRSLLEVRIATAEGTYAALATHLVTWGHLNRFSRGEQLECVRAHLGQIDVPWVLAGDFNATPEAGEMEAFRISGAGIEASPRAPTHRITHQQLDYVFASPGWTVGHSRVVEEGPSDHWPLVVQLNPPDAANGGGP